jgi:hypothetical protein
MHRSFVDILAEEQQNNQKIVEQVTGIVVRLPAPDLAPMLKTFMYHRFGRLFIEPPSHAQATSIA